MLLSDKLLGEFNAQLGRELEAFLQYLQIASYCDNENLPKSAKFFFEQAEEEKEHAMKFINFILEMGGKVEIPELKRPNADFSSLTEAVASALKWEKEVTDHICELVSLAKSEKNYLAEQFLDWFLEEQREEVNLMDTLLGIVKRAEKTNILLAEQYMEELRS